MLGAVCHRTYVLLHLIIKYVRSISLIVPLRISFLIDSDNASIDMYLTDNRVTARGVIACVSLGQELSACVAVNVRKM